MNSRLYVLACYECNDARSKAEARKEIFVPKLEHRKAEALEASAVPYMNDTPLTAKNGKVRK